MWKKVLFIFCGIIIAAAVIIFAGWLKAWLKPPVLQIPETAIVSPGNSIAPGAETTFSFSLTLPVTMQIKKVELFQNGKKLSEGNVKFSTWKFDRIKWLVSGNFRILETGKVNDLNTISDIEKFPGKNPPEIKVGLPELTCAVPENIQPGSELHLAPVPDAGEIDGSGTHNSTPFYKNRLFYALLLILIIAAIIIFFIVRRKKKIAELPLDEKTLQEIRLICSQVKAGNIRVETGFARLSDVVRNYLETRSGLPATRRTTAEFLLELSANPDLLNSEERIYLTGFLNHADLIKFAGVNAGNEMLDNAAAQAGNLVRTTTAAAIEKEKKNK